MEIARDNIGSVVAIIESLLLIIRTNVNSVFNFVTGLSLRTVQCRYLRWSICLVSISNVIRQGVYTAEISNA